MKSIEGIDLKQCGQPGPYQDSVYAGTVTAESEEEAKKKLAALRLVPEIFAKQDSEKWSRPYFTKFAKAGDNTWEFRIVEEYTG